MPNGKIHDEITWIASPVIAIATATTLQTINPENSVLIPTLLTTGGFLFSGLIFGPDLDLNSRPFKRWGKLRWIWRPYQKALSHRSWWSHGPVVGTTLRVIYLGTWIAGFMILVIALSGIVETLFDPTQTWDKTIVAKLKISGKTLVDTMAQNIPASILIGLGLELGSASHYLADWTSTAYKKRRNKHKKR